MKTCTKCKIEKPKTEFHKKISAKDGIRSECKICATARGRDWYANNSSTVSARMRLYYESNTDSCASRQRAYYESNKGKCAEATRTWAQSNPEKKLANARKRRARKLGAEGTHTAADVKAIFESQRGLCANCPEKLIKSGKNRYHVDHIQPLAKGGSNDKYNLQCLCPTCNMRKHDKDPLEWAKEIGKLL